MGNWKKEYEEIKVPENMKERIEASIARAKKDKRKSKKSKIMENMYKCSSGTGHCADPSKYESDSSGSHAADSTSGKSV